MSSVIVRVRVTLKGRLVKEYRFGQERVTIGRDPESSVFLDNPGISRCHAVLERQGDYVYLQDMESANGTYVNDEPVRRERVKDGDKVRIGKFLLELSMQEDRRGTAEDERPRMAAHEGTMVMDSAQIQRLLERTKQGEEQASVERARQPQLEPVPQGNVLRFPQSAVVAGAPAPQDVVAPAPMPRRFSAAWWHGQSMGIAIGFAIGLIAGVLMAGLLGG